MDAFELLSGDHFHVILHSDKEHGLIFNRLDGTVTTIYYSDAKELSNLSSAGSIYGIVGRYLDKYLVLIKNRARVGSLYEPNTKTEHEVFVITQVQVIDISHVKANEFTSRNRQPGATNIKVNSARSNNTVSYNVESAKNSDENNSSYTPSNRAEDDNDFSSLPITISTNSYNTAQSRAANWNPFKLANSLRPMMPTQLIKPSLSSDQLRQQSQHSSDDNSQSTRVTSQSSAPPPPTSPQDEANKRLVEEMIKLFNNTNSFYYSPTLDLTRRFSRRPSSSPEKSASESMWRTADRRFFWNRHMLNDIIELSKEDADANYFICIVLQGFIAIETHIDEPSIPFLDCDNGVLGTSMNVIKSMTNTSENTTNKSIVNQDSGGSDKQRHPNEDLADYREQSTPDGGANSKYQLALVSRRSVFQAGTRYRRRGCDVQGNCANFVETEQIVRCNQHFKSMIIIRGSIPLFWYQTGFNYRPPPVLIKSEEENQKAFAEHFLSLFADYDTEQIIAVDCTEQSGREKALHDAYKRHMERLQEFYPKAKLIEFDFHKHCSGRQCSDSQIEKNLRDCGLSEDLVKEVKYYWNDGEVVWNQEGVFRVNCLDCSDRTNVVQRAIALNILDLQLARLGIISPDASPNENLCRKKMQVMWSNNGNVLSTQYCGTRALFGGDRKLSGYIKDTYSSASRYYYSKFRDVYRQAAIDAMLGIESADRNSLLGSSSLKDQYELLHFDPIFASRSGSALLKDVGSRFSNRLARFKGKFHARGQPTSGGSGGVAYSNSSRGAAHYQHNNNRAFEATPGILETDLIDSLGEMSIDWPSTENIGDGDAGSRDCQQQEDECQDVFTRFKNCDDSFQDDDEFGQLMLSIDLAELQRLREEEEEQEQEEQTGATSARMNASEANGSQRKLSTSEDKPEPIEEIGMTEAPNIRSATNGDNPGRERSETNTTST